jgi:hypothetical protein
MEEIEYPTSAGYGNVILHNYDMEHSPFLPRVTAKEGNDGLQWNAFKIAMTTD